MCSAAAAPHLCAGTMCWTRITNWAAATTRRARTFSHGCRTACNETRARPLPPWMRCAGGRSASDRDLTMARALRIWLLLLALAVAALLLALATGSSGFTVAETLRAIVAPGGTPAAEVI